MESIKSDDKTKNSNSITSNNLEDEINTKLKVNDVPQNSITKSEDKNEIHEPTPKKKTPFKMEIIENKPKMLYNISVRRKLKNFYLLLTNERVL